MGISINTSVFIGFQVDESDIFDIQKKQSWSCAHVKEDPMIMDEANYCSQCGTKFSIRTYSSREFKENLKKIFNKDPYDVEFWSAEFGSHKIKLTQCMSNCGEQPIIAGITLKSIEPKYESAMLFNCGNPDKLPSKDVLKDFLESNSIPFDEDSFGIYLINEVY